MRVGTYPTRDFATLGNLLLSDLSLSFQKKKTKVSYPILTLPFKKGRKYPPEGTAISAALYMSPYRSDYIFPLVPTGVWRIVSEDSQECPHRSLDGPKFIFQGLSC